MIWTPYGMYQSNETNVVACWSRWYRHVQCEYYWYMSVVIALCVEGEKVWCMLLCANMLCGNKKTANSSFLWAQKQ